MSTFLVLSRYPIYSEVSSDGASHARFNNRMIYMLWSFITAWIVLLIAGCCFL